MADTSARTRHAMFWPTLALVVTQVLHVLAPIDSDKPESESWLGLPVGAVFLLLSVLALFKLDTRPWATELAAWAGLGVALGFVAYHAVPWSSVISNPYLGEPVGPWAWASVVAAVAAGLWTAATGRESIRTRLTGRGTTTAAA